MRPYDYELGHALAAEPPVATDYTDELIPILQLSLTAAPSARLKTAKERTRWLLVR
jgi:hypothetical protein